MSPSEGFETLIRTVLAAMIFFATAYRVVTALFEREIGSFGGLLLLVGLFALVVSAITNLNSHWYFLSLLAMFIWLALAFLLPALFMERERHKMIKEDLERALQGIAFDPSNVAAYCVLADTYRKMGNLDLAIENYRKALELQPTLKREKLRLETALNDKAILERHKRTRSQKALPLSSPPPQSLGLKLLRLSIWQLLLGLIILGAVGFLDYRFLSDQPWMALTLALATLIGLLLAVKFMPQAPRRS